MKILVQCAWCHKTMGYKYSKVYDDHVPKITHSICPNCYNNLMKETNSFNRSADVTFDGDYSNVIINRNLKSATKTI